MKGFNYNPLLLPRKGLKFPILSRDFPTNAYPRASSHLTIPVSHQAHTGHKQDK